MIALENICRSLRKLACLAKRVSVCLVSSARVAKACEHCSFTEQFVDGSDVDTHLRGSSIGGGGALPVLALALLFAGPKRSPAGTIVISGVETLDSRVDVSGADCAGIEYCGASS